MDLYVGIDKNRIMIVGLDDESVKGVDADVRIILRPGRSVFGLSYAELKAHGGGMLTYTPGSQRAHWKDAT